MNTRTPVEVSTRYATTVDDLPSAWAFVMDKLESVGPDPSVTISPVWVTSFSDPDAEPPRHFAVVVEGMVEEER